MQKTALILVLSLASFIAYSQTPFTCQDGISYIVKTSNGVSELYQVTLVPSYLETNLGNVRTSTGTNIPVDAIGYNVVDNFIYGFERGTSNVVKIGSNGVSERIAVSGGLPGSSSNRDFNAGDVDANGNLFLYQSGATSMYRINLNSSPYTATAITSSFSASLRDISVNNSGTQVYGYTTSGALIVRTISANSYTQNSVASNMGPTIQNTFYDKRGQLFAQKTDGAIYSVVPGSIASADGMVKLGGNEPPLNSDGAHCRNASVYNESVQPSFACNDGDAYFITHGSNGECQELNTTTNLAVINTKTYSRTNLLNITNSIRGGLINAIGFNPKDGYIWGYRFGTGHLARIGSDGSVRYFAIPGLEPGCGGTVQDALGAGDITADGIYYGYQGALQTGNNKTMYRIDLDPASPTYLTVLSATTFTTSAVITDIAFNPVDKNFYGASGGVAYKIDPTTSAVTSLTASGIPTDNMVATFCDPAGNFYFQGSATPLYRIPRVHGGGALVASAVSTTQLGASNGDAARCPLTFFAGIALSGNVWNDINSDRIRNNGELNTTTNDPSETLTVYLLNEDNVIVGKADVSDDGTWQIPVVPAGTYTLSLSNNADLAVSSSGAAIIPNLPGNWVNTGINFGTAGAAGSSSGPITVSPSDTDKSNLNFGIRDNSVVISGTVFNDANGNAIQNTGETGTDAGATSLTAYLLNAAGNVVSSSDVSASGTYSFANASANTAYSVVLSNTPGIAVGNPATAAVPTGWINTGETFGTGNAAGTGVDPTTTPGLIAVITPASGTVTGVNFGIQQIPTAGNGVNSGVNLPGIQEVNVPLNTFTNVNPSSDTAPGTITSIAITAIPTGATSITVNGIKYGNGGATIPEGGVIIQTDESGLPVAGTIVTLDPVADGATTVTIPFVAIDNAGARSVNTDTEGTAVLNLIVTYPISGTVFNDNDAMTGGADAGAGGSILPDVQVDLYQADGTTLITSVNTDANGNYTFPDQIPGDYVVKVNLPSTPGGETAYQHVSSSDTSPTDGSTSVNISNTAVTGVNFGVNQSPTAVATNPASKTNPGGTVSEPITNGFAGTDPAAGVITSLTIPIFPTNATSLTVGTTTYFTGALSGPCPTSNCVLFPAEGIIIPTSTSGVPSSAVSVDPLDGDITVAIQFTVTDNAGLTSTTATLNIPFTSPMPVKLSAFNIRKSDANAVELTWTTTEELNSERFDIEHSTDGIYWNTIETLAAKGKSNDLVHYRYVHAIPVKGLNLYRLKMVDNDDTFEYSKMVSINIDAIHAGLYVFPNPSQDLIRLGNLDSIDLNKVEIIDLKGKVVYSANAISPDGIDTKHFAAGTYIISVMLKDGSVQNNKIVIRK